jgi:hypothetical protein
MQLNPDPASISRRIRRSFFYGWNIWCRVMGERISDDNRECDTAAIIRTVFWLTNMITCAFIIANVIRHW